MKMILTHNNYNLIKHTHTLIVSSVFFLLIINISLFGQKQISVGLLNPKIRWQNQQQHDTTNQYNFLRTDRYYFLNPYLSLTIIKGQFQRVLMMDYYVETLKTNNQMKYAGTDSFYYGVNNNVSHQAIRVQYGIGNSVNFKRSSFSYNLLLSLQYSFYFDQTETETFDNFINQNYFIKKHLKNPCELKFGPSTNLSFHLRLADNFYVSAGILLQYNFIFAISKSEYNYEQYIYGMKTSELNFVDNHYQDFHTNASLVPKFGISFILK